MPKLRFLIDENEHRANMNKLYVYLLANDELDHVDIISCLDAVEATRGSTVDLLV